MRVAQLHAKHTSTRYRQAETPPHDIHTISYAERQLLEFTKKKKERRNPYTTTSLCWLPCSVRALSPCRALQRRERAPLLTCIGVRRQTSLPRQCLYGGWGARIFTTIQRGIMAASFVEKSCQRAAYCSRNQLCLPAVQMLSVSL